jgi:hypothetical protein
LPIHNRTEEPARRSADQLGEEMLHGCGNSREAARRGGNQFHQEVHVGRCSGQELIHGGIRPFGCFFSVARGLDPAGSATLNRRT